MPLPIPEWSRSGYELYKAWLAPHDYLWFSSFDSGATSSTVPVIHNYALAYALNRYERTITWASIPSYAEDLARFQIYPTPARADSGTAAQTVITYNAVDERTQRTDEDQSHNTPMVGWRRVVMPYTTRGEHVVAARFEFFVFVKGEMPLPRVIRIGKKRCPARLDYQRLHAARLLFGDAAPSHLVNPLDVRGRLRLFVPISIPPSLVLESASIEADWFLRTGDAKPEYVHVPARVSNSWSAL